MNRGHAVIAVRRILPVPVCQFLVPLSWLEAFKRAVGAQAESNQAPKTCLNHSFSVFVNTPPIRESHYLSGLQQSFLSMHAFSGTTLPD
jgi:hypothetical protein